MTKITLYSDSRDIIQHLLSYLHGRRYKNVSVNYTEGIITATRREKLLKLTFFHFKIIHNSKSVTTIELSVNPKKSRPSKTDALIESKLEENIYAYL